MLANTFLNDVVLVQLGPCLYIQSKPQFVTLDRVSRGKKCERSGLATYGERTGGS